LKDEFLSIFWQFKLLRKSLFLCFFLFSKKNFMIWSHHIPKRRQRRLSSCCIVQWHFDFWFWQEENYFPSHQERKLEPNSPMKWCERRSHFESHRPWSFCPGYLQQGFGGSHQGRRNCQRICFLSKKLWSFSCLHPPLITF